MDTDEDAATACVREVREETGLHVRVQHRLGEVTVPGSPSYVVEVFGCQRVRGTVHAGSDASAAEYVAFDQLQGRTLTPHLRSLLRSWAVLRSEADVAVQAPERVPKAEGAPGA